MLVWRSSDPMLQAHEASGALAGRTVVGISAGDLSVCSCHHLQPVDTAAASDTVASTCHSHMRHDGCHRVPAGKYRTAAVTKEGDVFMWEGWSQPLHAGSGASGRLGTPQLPPAPPPGSSPGTSASLQVHARVARAEILF